MSGVDDGHLMTFLRYLNSGAKGLLGEGGKWGNFVMEDIVLTSSMIYAYSQSNFAG